METKKSPKVNLEKKRFLLLELGFIIALGVCFAAFEWSTPEVDGSNLGQLGKTENFEPDMQPTITPPPPPKPIVKEPEVIPETLTVTKDTATTDLSKLISDPIEGKYPIIITPIIPDEPETPEPTTPIGFYLVEVKPVYPGGEGEMLKFLSENTNYPEIPRKNGVGGIVHVSFVIDVTGRVTDVALAHGVDPYLDKEALRVVSTMPMWTPGSQRTVKVPVSYIIPIKFVIY
jgi:periplasmic protein TonB